MNFIDQIQSYLPIITTVVIIVGWFIRLETTQSNLKSNTENENKELRERIRAVEIKAAGIDSLAGDIKAINGKLDILLRKAQL